MGNWIAFAQLRELIGQGIGKAWEKLEPSRKFVGRRVDGAWRKLDQLDAFAGRHILRAWKWVRPRFWKLLGAKVFLSGFAFFIWWLHGIVAKQTGTVSTFVVVIVGLLVTGLLAYLVHKKFQEGGVYSGNWRKKTKPAEQKEPAASPKKQKPEAVASATERSSKRGWLWPAIAMTTLGWLVLGDSLKEKWQRDVGGRSTYAESSRNVAYRDNEDDASLSREGKLAVIGDCESGDCTPGSGHQFNADGSVVTNQNDDGTYDLGEWQINSSHEAEAKALGIDLRTREGNYAFAIHLYERYGTAPWNASRDRWEPLLADRSGDRALAKAVLGVATATRVLNVGREWSEWVSVPSGQELYCERMELVAFEAETQSGRTFQFPRNFKGHTRVPGNLTRIRFRVTDEAKETLPMWLRFSPL